MSNKIGRGLGAGFSWIFRSLIGALKHPGSWLNFLGLVGMITVQLIMGTSFTGYLLAVVIALVATVAYGMIAWNTSSQANEFRQSSQMEKAFGSDVLAMILSLSTTIV